MVIESSNAKSIAIEDERSVDDEDCCPWNSFSKYGNIFGTK